MTKRINTISVRRGISLIITAISFLALFTLSVFWIYTEIKDNRKTRKFIKETVLSTQRIHIKKEAERSLVIIKALIKAQPGVPQEEIQNQALHILEQMRFGYGGYVFVNRYDGLALINSGKIVKGKVDMKKKYDPLGNNLFALEMSAAKKPGGDFIRYYYSKMGENTPVPKISYIIGFDEWGWIIGAGDYVADANKEVNAVNKNLIKKLKRKIMLIFLVFVVTFLTTIVVSNFVSKKVADQLNLLVSHFKNGDTFSFEDKKFWLKEVRSLARDINAVEKQKKKAENDLKKLNENLEMQVQRRTNDLLEKNKKLERFNQLYADREFRIKELKDELKKLKAELEECKKWIRK